MVVPEGSHVAGQGFQNGLKYIARRGGLCDFWVEWL